MINLGGCQNGVCVDHVPHWTRKKNEPILSNEITWHTRTHFVVMHLQGSLLKGLDYKIVKN